MLYLIARNYLIVDDLERIPCFSRDCFEAAPFEDAGKSKPLDDGPLAADHRTQVVVFARAILLQIATSHDHDLVVFIFIRIGASDVESIEFGIPELEDPSPKTLGLADHDVVAAVPSLFAFTRLYIRRGDQLAGQLLHCHIEKDEGEEESTDGPADDPREFLAGDSSMRR